MRKIINYISGKNRPKIAMKPRFVVLHNTGNENAGAMAHRNYAQNNNRSASYHWAVDDIEAVAIIPENEMAWHAGDGRNGNGNKYGIAIEMCENGDWNKTYKNTVELTAERLRANNLPITALKGHRDFSKKNCPRKLIPIWGKFVNDVENEMKGTVNVSPPRPQSTVLRRGSKGQAVKLLQLDLMLLRYNIGPYGADGSFGPATETAVRQLQREHGLVNDGIAGKQTLSKIEELKKPKKKSTNIKVDGYLGEETIKGIQRKLGTPVDGKISKPSLMVRKLQEMVKVKIDGYWGVETTKGLQKYFRTPVDGKISKPSLLIKAMQRWVNE